MNNNDWFSIDANSETKVAGIWFHNVIAGPSQLFADAVAQLKDHSLVVHVNSPGGSVTDGLAIFDILAAWPSKVVCKIEGVAASVASIIAMAGSEVSMSENALLMIHDPSLSMTGRADDLRAAGTVLDKWKTVLSGIYAKRSGKPLAEIQRLMAAETWFSAGEAKAFGFVDKVLAPLRSGNAFNWSGLKNVPQNLLALDRGAFTAVQAENAGLRQQVTQLKVEVARHDVAEALAGTEASRRTIDFLASLTLEQPAVAAEMIQNLQQANGREIPTIYAERPTRNAFESYAQKLQKFSSNSKVKHAYA